MAILPAAPLPRDRQELADEIAKAVRAEREACAAIAEEAERIYREFTAESDLRYVAAQSIALSIRGRK